MKELESVAIVYHNGDRIKFQILTEFLRLGGIYVDEYCITDEKKNPASAEAASLVWEIKSKDYHNETDEAFCSSDAQHQVLEEFLKANWEQLKETQFGAVCKDLEKVFLNPDSTQEETGLFQAGITLQYFRMNDNLVYAVKEKFRAAAREITKYIEKQDDWLDNRHLEYARISCWQKANLAALLCKKSIAYYIDELGNDCRDLIQAYPDFSNAWALLGFVYEFWDTKLIDSINAFDRALADISKRRFASSVYYWQGRRCEKDPVLKEKKDSAYRKAYELSPKYRNIYKIAMYEEEKKHWNEAISYLEKCISLLAVKKQYLDPLEQEYYFKVHVRIGFLYIYKLEEYNKAITFLEEAKQFKGKLQERDFNRFAWQVYGTEADKYIELSKRRMGEKNLNEYLLKAKSNLKIK